MSEQRASSEERPLLSTSNMRYANHSHPIRWSHLSLQVRTGLTTGVSAYGSVR